jgi:hypothetical protein
LSGDPTGEAEHHRVNALKALQVNTAKTLPVPVTGWQHRKPQPAASQDEFLNAMKLKAAKVQTQLQCDHQYDWQS